MATPRAPRYPALDLWRGVASIFVVLFHTTLVFAPTPVDGEVDLLARVGGGLVALTRRLHLGVPMFFVISGYCISATADAHRLRGAPVREYFRRRFRRIFPPYWAAILLQAVLLFLIDVVLAPGLMTGSAHPIRRPWSFTPWQYLGNLTLTESWRPALSDDPQAYILGQAWTLCFEEQFYAVTGLLLLLAPGRLFSGALVVSAVTLVVGHLAPRAGISLGGLFLDGSWLMFAAGIALYHARNYARPRWALSWLPVFAAGAVYAGHVGQGNLRSACAFAALLLVLDRSARAPRLPPRLRAPLEYLGKICYSLYLVHAPIARGVSQAFASAGRTGPWEIILVVITLSVALSLAMAHLFWTHVEQKFLNPKVSQQRG